jgi:prepilin-type processing-associated H-X9-DG protein
MYADTNNDKAPFSFSWLYSMKTIFSTASAGAGPGPYAATSGGIRCPQGCRWHYDKDPPDGTLWPDLRNIKVHICPTFRSIAMSDRQCNNKGDGDDPPHDPTLPFNPTYSYSMNRWLGLYCPPLYTASEAEQARLLSFEPSLRLSQVKRTVQCFAFSEENMWTIDHRPGDGAKWYSTTPIGKNDLWLYANKNARNSAVANFATYHNVSGGKRNEGYANAVFVDGHVSTVKGLAGYDAYLEFGRPFNGHEIPNIW